MTWQIVISTASLALTAIMALMIYSWKGGEWTGGERRHSEDVERRLDAANAEMSKIASTMQGLMLIGKDVAVLQSQHQAFDRDLNRLEQRVSSVERQK